MKREEYEERMKDSKYRELIVTNCDSGKDYVFISYRGNSWRKVLTDIVYKLQKEYKLRIYFDKEFASETNVWLEQFTKNMDSSHCKACLCFFDEGYVTSYATLLELMHAMNPRSKLRESIFPISFPINWGKLDSADGNTGLGVKDPDNPTWEKEKEAFEREFKLIKRNYPAIEAYYYEGAELRECDCKDIMQLIQPENKREYVDDEAYYKQFIVDPLKKKYPYVFEEVVGTQYINNDKNSTLKVKESETVPEQNSEIRYSFEPNSDDRYKYTIFGENYEAGSREQGKLMFDAFEALVKRYPECVDALTQRTSISRVEDVEKANTQDAKPPYFRGCKEFSVNGQRYLVGTSYGFNAKLAEIRGMFRICGADLSEFVLNGEPLKSNNSAGESSGKKSVNSDDIFEYELFGSTHTSGKMVDMLNDIFDLIAEKHPEKIKDIAENDKITAVARKTDLDEKTANISKIKQFSNYKGKEHSVEGEVYCVNAGYNRDGCIKQIERMLIVCGGNSNDFKITKAPHKSTHSASKSGKKDIGEILNA